MSIDEQVKRYTNGFSDGAGCEYLGYEAEIEAHGPDYARGYHAGYAAYLAAERAERERLSYCGCCEVRQGIGMVCWTPKPNCPDCHGTGRRTP